jgi:hypothetical protein
VVGTATITITAVVHTVTVTSPRNFIVPNDTMKINVVLLDTLGNVLTGKPISYSSSDNNVASVSNGVVTGGPNAGSVTITATSEGKNGTLSLSGIPGIANMVVTGPAGSLAVDTLLGGTQPTTKDYTVTVTDAGGNPLVGRVVTVTNSSPSTIAVATGPMVTDGQGKVKVTATAGAPSGSSTITFTAAAREGAVPPGTPGSNTPSGSIRITVQ